MFRKLPSIFLLVAALGGVAGTVGDFAPLKAGHKWKYNGNSATRYMSTLTKNFDRVRIISAQSTTNQSTYMITTKDSIFNHYESDPNYHKIPDTVITYSCEISEQAGSIYSNSWKPSDLNLFFLYHTVPETSITGKTFLAGKNRWVYATPTEKVFYTSAYAQDIGLVNYRFSLGEGRTVETLNYDITEFNGEPVGNFTVVGISILAEKQRRYYFNSFEKIGMVAWTGRNVLGRALPKIFPYK